MIILLLLIVTFQSSYSNLEVCEPFPIHHNFYNCDVLDGGGRRAPTPIYCQNQGTWGCTKFKSTVAESGDGYVRFGEMIHTDCCTYKEIHYVDMWINASIINPPRRSLEFIVVDWVISIYGIIITGGGELGNHGSIFINDTEFTNAYNGPDEEDLFISVIFRYDDDDDDCDTKLEVDIFINATFVGNITLPRFELFETPTYECDNTSVLVDLITFVNHDINDVTVFISAHTIIPTLEQIEYLYSLGKNRSTGVEICYNSTCPECTECTECTECIECTEGNEVSSSYITAIITLSIIVLIFGLLILFLVFKSQNFTIKTQTMWE